MALMVGCVGAYDPEGESATPVSGSISAQTPRQLFETTVKPIHDEFCPGCHSPGGTAPNVFLPTDATAYDVMMSSGKVIVGSQAAASRLLVWGISPLHSGPEYTLEQLQVVVAWLAAEAPHPVTANIQ
jgi:hypothetical protein